jgi:hypothetical protein
MAGPSDDERQRIRAYLRGQGAKRIPAELVDRVREAMGELSRALATVPTARLYDRPAPEEWSANEVMAHVVEAGRYFGAWIETAIDGRGDGPAMPERKGEAPRRTAEEWLGELRRDREALFARVLAADPGARLEPRVPHGWFGPLNWRETLLFFRLHDLDHAGQLAKNAAALS